MHLLDLTLDTALENIALDEALLESAEETDSPEVLRIWEPAAPVVVLGRSSPHSTEVNWDYCESQEIPVIRRCSGGATVVGARSCLMYALLLDYRTRPELRSLDYAHQFVMNKMAKAIGSLGVETTMQGTCDLTIGDKKFSGNALRCKRNWLIYHGTMLCRGSDLQLVANCLGRPKRQPDYRNMRDHLEFLTTLPLNTIDLKFALVEEWQAKQEFSNWPSEMTERLVQEKYSTNEWTKKV